MQDALYHRWLLVGPLGLAVRVVWFDDLLWGEGPVMFRTDVEADLYIEFVQLMLNEPAEDEFVEVDS